MNPVPFISRPLIINTAYTGAVSDKSKNPNVPYTTAEIVESAAQCLSLGSALGHFHVRNSDGSASNDPDKYAELFASLRADPRTKEVVIVASTSGRHGQSLEDRCSVLRLPENLRPEMASLTLSSLNFATGESINKPDDIRALAEVMNEHGVKPELEIFDLGMISFSHRLIAEGLLSPPFYFNIILGNIAGAQTDLASVAALTANLPADSVISFGGIGKAQMPSHLLALTSADGVRTGLEDNLWYAGRRESATNPGLVKGIRDLAEFTGRTPMSPAELRETLGLKTP